MSQTDQLVPFDIPLNGRCITAVDPILIGENDFQSQKNMRPTDHGIKGIAGMSKINIAAAEYAGIKNGFHFKKDQPLESHVLIQANDQTAPATASRIVISDNTTLIPEQDTFSSFETLDNNNLLRFSKAPQGSVVACNGSKNYVWGGNEYRCGFFIIADPDNPTTKYDYSDVISNTLTDALNVATMKTVGGGIDAYTSAYYAFENDMTDSSGNSHTLTAVGAVFSSTTDELLMGSYSWKGTGSLAAQRDITADSHFDLSSGIFTVTMKHRPTNLGGNRGLFELYKDGNNCLNAWIDTNGAIHVDLITGGVQKIGTSGLVTATDAVEVGIKYAIEIGRDSSHNWYIYVDGKVRATVNDIDVPLNNYVTLYIGYASSASDPLHGTLDEVKIDKGICRHTEPFTPPSSAFSSSATSYAYIGCTRPIKGAKFYVQTANTSAATSSVNYWDGSAWQAVSGLNDSTSSGGATLAEIGSVSFDDTKTIAKTKIYNNSMAYWYQFVFSGVDATTTISRVTLSASIQTIKDIWDGIPRNVMSFFTYTTNYNDYSTNVLYEEYDSTDEGTFVNIGGLTSSQYILVGFAEQTTAISFHLAGEKVNTTASTLCTIYYWNGSAWTTAGTLEDNTSEGMKSINKSGIVMWNAPSPELEFPTSIKDENPVHYYKIAFDKTLSADVYVDYIYGIPAQKTLGNYTFPILWQDRTWLCADQTASKNSMLGSSYLSDSVFNGTDSPKISFDGDESVVSGTPIFSRYGGTIYENLIMCKRSETYLVDTTSTTSTSTTSSTTSTNYHVYKVAANVGCVAPMTMKLCDIGFQLAPGLNRHAAIWQSSGGIVMFDGNSIIPISDDIQNFFDPSDPDYINTSIIDHFNAFYDETNKEYHWLFATGTNTSLNKEWAYDLKRRKWFEVVRSVPLQCGWNVQDALGNGYVYGGTSSGYIERLEHGSTMDGVAIDYSFRLGDRAFSKSMMLRSEIRHLKLTGKSKSISSQPVIVKDYLDGSNTGTAIASFSQRSSGRRIYSTEQSVGKIKAVTHSIECSVSTDDEANGFEPVIISGMARIDKEAILT